MTSLGPEDGRRLSGDIPDRKIVNIVAKNPTIESLTSRSHGPLAKSDIMGKERHPLSRKTAELYDVLVADEAWDEARGRTPR